MIVKHGILLWHSMTVEVQNVQHCAQVWVEVCQMQKITLTCMLKYSATDSPVCVTLYLRYCKSVLSQFYWIWLAVWNNSSDTSVYFWKFNMLCRQLWRPRSVVAMFWTRQRVRIYKAKIDMGNYAEICQWLNSDGTSLICLHPGTTNIWTKTNLCN